MMKFELLRKIDDVVGRIRKPKSIKRNSILDDIVFLSKEKARFAFDVGAHHGMYSIELNNRIQLEKIFCFEPFPESFNILKQNLISPIYNHQQLALSDYAGISTFYVNQFDETNSLLPSIKTNSQIDHLTAPVRTINVHVDTLENFCKIQSVEKIDVLKIDAQGNSLNVLKGATGMLERRAIRLIQCEVEFLEIYKDEPLYHKIAFFLEGHGYLLYSLYNIHYDVNGRLSWADALFYPNAEEDQGGN